MSSEHAEEERLLRQQVEQSERVLDGLETELQEVNAELEELAQRNHRYDVLADVCRSLEELDGIGAAHLFWDASSGTDNPAEYLRNARRRISEFGEEVALVEERRESILQKVGKQNDVLDYLHYDLQDAIEREEARRNEWLVERELDALPNRSQVMPWSRGCEEDQRFRKSLGTSLAASLVIALLVSTIALPIMERATVNELPERVAKLVRQERALPPPPVAEPVIPEEEPPEPDPKVVEEQPPEELPESIQEPKLASVEQTESKEQVKSKGILAFRDSFASRANLRPTARLGSQARVKRAGEDAVGRPERMMVASLAPGSSGGINLSDISRDVGGGGGDGIEGVQLTRVASSIGGGDGPARPLSGGAMAGRTDEEIQIVFDRYKAALYRLYNRELRKDPTLRGQLVLRLTIEPDGSVSLCQLHSSDMDAPTLAQQVVERVQSFDFGAKEDIVAMTIIYPIDFLPAA
ncbi:MAG: AgmX/PglI C-terminal domain-containing protein [Gammaproteobacteria bacterium]|nr:AgmX/PglI C-terminal domain-containing protein [Gammaproteobacteria bacterium]MDH3428797.1 AgmX/PglI C-terminal domain-containing protein [Gammaproteobacteria bacterium]